MQSGAESTAAIRYCYEHGISVVHNRCVMMLAGPV
jgi:predicted CoA-binding protein